MLVVELETRKHILYLLCFTKSSSTQVPKPFQLKTKKKNLVSLQDLKKYIINCQNIYIYKPQIKKQTKKHAFKM